MSFLPIARLVPRACSTERVGNEMVAFDAERWQYHTMHERVFDVLRFSDGTRDLGELAGQAFGGDDDARRDLTGQAVLDLMDAGLLVEDQEARAHLLTRRAAGKAAAAVVLGAVGLPLVKSITAPDAASAATRCGGEENTADCSGGQGCKSCCCCRVSPVTIICADRSACEPNYECIP